MFPIRTVDELVAEMSAVPEGFHRTVATDADGTLWSTDVGDELFVALGETGDFRGDARRGMWERARVHLGEELPDGDLAVVRAVMKRYAAGLITIEDICELQGEAVGERTESELIELYERVARRVAQTVRPESRALLIALKRMGFAVHVVSGSLGDAVEHCMRCAGLPFDTVAGATLARDGDVVLPRLAAAVPLFEGKVRALEAAGAWPAALGMGDGGWDVTFLKDVHRPVLVHPKPALMEAMRDHPRAVVIA